MKVHSLLTQDMVIPELESVTRDGVLKEMAVFLKRVSGVNYPHKVPPRANGGV